MIEKFRSLSKGKQILVGILAFIFLPITFFALSVNLVVKGIKGKKVGKILGGALCTLLSFSIISTIFTTTPTDDTSAQQEPEQEQSQEVANNQEEEQEQEEPTKEEPTKEESKNPFGNVMEKPVMNGSKTERIGTYAEVMAGGIGITKENLLAFYEEVVKDSDYNWVTINIDGTKGIQFTGAMALFTYGEIDNEACIVTSEGTGFINGDSIDYE